MPKSRGKRKREEQPAVRRSRPFWSGLIAFGLVSIPVNLYPASRTSRHTLRMLGPDGHPLTRRYFCPEEGKELTRDEIVRGYEVAEGRFVLVSDDELEALEPEKSQEIDLKRFVPLGEIDPAYFERPYFLAPAKGAAKAYRLLARAMEEGERAGVATVVMRGKEYLIAIIGEGGLLRAQVLRFEEELRSPEEIGLPEPAQADTKRIQAIRAAVGELTQEQLDSGWLVDREQERLVQLVERKLSSGEGVVASAAAAAQEDEEEAAPFVDLMQLLKESLQGEGISDEGAPQDDTALERQSRADLYEMARELDIPGRSSMNKDQLLEALRRRR